MDEIKIEFVADSDNVLWQKYFDLCQEIFRKYYPAGFDPENTLENFREAKQSKASFVRLHEDYIVMEGGVPAAWINITIAGNDFYFGLDVLGDDISERMLKAIVSKVNELMKENSCSESVTYTFREVIMNSFRNAKTPVYDESLISRIDRANMNRSLYENILNNNELNQWKLVCYHDLPDEILPRFIEFINGIIDEISKINPYSVRLYPFTIMSWKEMMENQRNFSNSMSILVLFDVEENIAGLCWVFNNSKLKSTISHNMGLTAVDPKYRRKGIAKFLKAKLYLKLLSENKDFKYITTDTMPWNKYMYRINEEFGFKPHRKGTSFKLTKDFLENYLNLK